jgi:hypothetical protein
MDYTSSIFSASHSYVFFTLKEEESGDRKSHLSFLKDLFSLQMLIFREKKEIEKQQSQCSVKGY